MHPDWLSNSFAVADREGGTAIFVDSGADIAPLTRQMMSTWAAFAHTGNPNNAALPSWPRFDAGIHPGAVPRLRWTQVRLMVPS